MPKLDNEPLDSEQKVIVPDPPVDDDPGVDATLVAAPGIVRELPELGPNQIRDEFTGKVWTLPSGTLDDVLGISIFKSPRDFPKDPRFHYECDNVTNLQSRMAQGFVPVTLKELGLEQGNKIGEASPLDGYYIINDSDDDSGGQIAIKIPREIAAQRYEALKRVSDAARDAVKRGVYTQTEGLNEKAQLTQRSDGLASDWVGPVSRTLNQSETHSEPTRSVK